VKFERSVPTGINAFTGYGEGYVIVNGVRHASSMIVTAQRVIPWDVSSFEGLTEADFAPLAQMGLEIVLLGTGARQRFPDPRLLRRLARAGIGVEVMDAQAACRTYNILIAESRRVAAALLFA
jgi:uncharacterized protein